MCVIKDIREKTRLLGHSTLGSNPRTTLAYSDFLGGSYCMVERNLGNFSTRLDCLSFVFVPKDDTAQGIQMWC